MENRFHLDDYKMYVHLNRFLEHNNIEILDISEDSCTLRHVSTEESLNINGVVHGGLLATMLDAAACILPRYRNLNTATNVLNINFLRPGRGTLYAKAEFVKRGKRIDVVHSWVYDEEDNIICDAIINMCRID